jgi:hypothetical protein
MPDIKSVLERAAAAPTRAPEVDAPYRHGRRARSFRNGALAAVLIVAVVAVVATTRSSSPAGHRVVVQTPPPPEVASSADADITVAAGWVTSTEPLAWWLHSPFELFSISTSPLPPSPHVNPNEAACPSEIPAVAVDNLPADGAYLWIGEWRPHEGIYTTAPRPPTFSGVAMDPECPLPRGEQAFGATYRDGARDFSVTYVLGPDAPASRRAEIDQMLNSLRFH